MLNIEYCEECKKIIVVSYKACNAKVKIFSCPFCNAIMFHCDNWEAQEQERKIAESYVEMLDYAEAIK